MDDFDPKQRRQLMTLLEQIAGNFGALEDWSEKYQLFDVNALHTVKATTSADKIAEFFTVNKNRRLMTVKTRGFVNNESVYKTYQSINTAKGFYLAFIDAKNPLIRYDFDLRLDFNKVYLHEVLFEKALAARAAQD